MTLDSFNLVNRFSKRVVRPSLLPQIPDSLFKEGEKACPCCTAFMLYERGANGPAGMLLDQSFKRDLQGQVTIEDRGQNLSKEAEMEEILLKQIQQSEELAEVTTAVSRLSLWSGDRFHPDIRVRHYAQGQAKEGCRPARSHYGHMDGKGQHCKKLREHNLLVTLVTSWITKSLEEKYETLISEVNYDRVLSESKRRPDARFVATFADLSELSVAVEIQRSNITLEKLQDRHHDLLKESDRVIWVFRKYGSSDNLKSASQQLQRNAQFVWANSGDAIAYFINPDRDKLILGPADIELISVKDIFFQIGSRAAGRPLPPKQGGSSRCTYLEAKSDQSGQPQDALDSSIEIVGDIDIDLFRTTVPETPKQVKRRLINERKVTAQRHGDEMALISQQVAEIWRRRQSEEMEAAHAARLQRIRAQQEREEEEGRRYLQQLQEQRSIESIDTVPEFSGNPEMLEIARKLGDEWVLMDAERTKLSRASLAQLFEMVKPCIEERWGTTGSELTMLMFPRSVHFPQHLWQSRFLSDLNRAAIAPPASLVICRSSTQGNTDLDKAAD